MAPPDRQGSFANSAIWFCTLLAIAALTLWKFEIWPIAGVVTNTGTIDSKQVAANSIAVAPITVAGPGQSDDHPSMIEPVDSTSDDAPPPAELAKLDIAGSLPPVPSPDAPDWSREPPPLPPADSPRKLNPTAPNCLPTGADFGATGAFPQAKQPRAKPATAAPPEQLKPVPTDEPTLQPIGQKTNAAISPQNPFVDTAAASMGADSASPVDTAHFESNTSASTQSVEDPRLARIDADIAANHYLAAHRALSKLYWDEPKLRPEIQNRIDQTATSIYFNPQPHYMPAHKPTAGRPLSEIAKQYHVPAEYLARLNNLDDSAAVKPGQDLKVIKGPFAAVVDPDNQTLTIHAHGYYVRQFPCEVALEGPPADSFQILAEEANTFRLAARPTTPGENPFSTAADAPPAGTIRLADQHASLAQDLLAPGAKITIRKRVKSERN